MDVNVCTARSYGVIVWELLTGSKPQRGNYRRPRCDALDAAAAAATSVHHLAACLYHIHHGDEEAS